MQNQNPLQITISPEYLASQSLSSDFPKRFWEKVNKNGPIPKYVPNLGSCWMWMAGDDGRGYGYIKRIKLRNIRAHVASWILNRGPIQKGFHVLHLCNITLCVNPNHLCLGTHAENMKYMAECGRSTIGEKSRSAKLTEIDVLEIRKCYIQGNSVELAMQFGVDSSHIWRIAHRKYWKHI